MQRISRDQMFMMMAEVAAMRSTCRRLAVGAVLVDKDHNFISMGYNGPPSGEPHCTGNDCGNPFCTRSDHAEANAIERGNPDAWHNLRSCTLYVTASPCEHCWEKIVNTKSIGRVVFKNEYRISGHLKGTSCGIQVEKITASGYVTDFITGRLVGGPEEA